jgi:GntR family transcriptional regulator
MTLSIDHKSSTPLHVQVEALLREMIKLPDYQNGKTLPNEVDLAIELKISRSTLRQAINKLVYEELLVRKKKSGTKVARPKVSSKSMNWLSFSQEMRARGTTIKNYELHVSWVLPDDHLAEFFEIAKEKKILKLERLRGDTDKPFVYFISYFHPRTGLTGEEDFKRPLYDILERDYNIAVDLSREEISAKLADKNIAGKLEIELNSAVLVRKRYVFDQGERPVEFNLGFYNAESFSYTIESRR